MENVAFWMFFLPFLMAVLSWAWLLLARLKRWPLTEAQAPASPESETPIPDEEEHPSTQPSAWYRHIWANKWSFGLVVLIAAGAAYFIFFAPPRMGGEIPISPNQPGRPFFNFHWQRDYLDKNDHHIALLVSLAGSIAALLSLTWAHWRRNKFGAQVALLFSGLTLAGLGQWILKDGTLLMGGVLYGMAALTLITWVWGARQRVAVDLAERGKMLRQNEIWLIIALLGLTAFARLYALPSVPYGVEGDESKWIFEVVELMIDGDYESSAEYHRDALPGSFYMQAPFQRLLGVGIFSARLGVVIYSVLGTLAFYGLLRQIAPLRLAALATFFLSISVMDISASRLANVESHVKLWPILALALLAMALAQKRWQAYALSGLALALGLLTYDTVLPVAGVGLLLLVIEFFTERQPVKTAVQNLTAFIFPPLLTIPLLVPYFVSRLSYYQISDKGWDNGWLETFGENFSRVVQSWFVETRFDFIYNRQGPILNAVLLPLLVLGIIIAFATLRSRISRWALAWMLLLLIPVPVLTASPFGRVYYPGLPAVYALIALGGYILGREVVRILGHNLLPVGLILGVVILSWLPLYNFYLYFNGVGEPGDRQIRREIGEFALSAAQSGSHLYMPYWPTAKDPLFVEWQIAELYLHQELDADQIEKAYTQIPLDEFLPHFTERAHQWQQVDVLIDKQTSAQRQSWEAAAETLFRCYPGGVLFHGEFFDVYRMTAKTIAQPRCAPVSLHVEADEDDAPSITWALSSARVSSLQVVCEQERGDVLWVEAENFEHGPGWGSDVAFVSDWAGSGYLVDSYGSQTAAYHTALESDQTAYIWVRYYKRAADASPAFMVLGDVALPFADTTADQINQWVWERIGPFTLTAEEQIWRISRPYAEPPATFMALFIDSVVFTSDPDFSPLEDIARAPAYDQGHPLPSPAQSGLVHIGLLTGRYFCKLGIISEFTLVDAYGSPEIWSDSVEIQVP